VKKKKKRRGARLSRPGTRGDMLACSAKMGNLVSLVWVTRSHAKANRLTLPLGVGDPWCAEKLCLHTLRLRFEVLVEVLIEIVYGQIMNS
jgi:hypothetical protein